MYSNYNKRRTMYIIEIIEVWGVLNMYSWEGKHFSITDPKDVSTVVYQINETEKEFQKDAPKYTVTRLDYTEELNGELKKKTFYVDNPSDDKDELVILSFGKEKVVINMAILEDDKVIVAKKPMPLKFNTLFSEDESEYKEFKYTPNLKRPISIIDPVTTEEIKPILYFDQETNEIKGKCKLKANKSYFAFEIRDKKDINN